MAKGMVCAPNRLGSDMKMDLLWENASPTSGFGPQTISLDMSKYDGVAIEFIQSMVATNLHSTAFGTNGYIMGSVVDSVIVYRTAYINGDSITFAAAAKDAGTIDNNVCIPNRIYGIKGVA